MFHAAPRYPKSITLIRISRKYGGRNDGATSRTPSATPASTSAPTPAPEQPGRPEEQHQHEEREDHELLERAWQQRGTERLGQPYDEAAQQRADEVAHAAQHHDHERHDVERLADVGRDVEKRRDQRAGHGHSAGADTEGRRADPRDVDAHQHGA